MTFAIVTSIGFSVGFYFILQFMNKQQIGERSEIKLIHSRLNLKVKGGEKKRILKMVDAYYTGLFFFAAFTSFYINTTLILIVVNIIIFILGMYLGSKLLLRYAKRIARK